MKRENLNFKKKSIKDYVRDYNKNPELLRLEINQHDFSDKKGRLKKLNNHSYNSKINSNPSSRIINHNIDMDAKIKHRKKREGD
jgi:hypothetical protein